jgi:hypothetical protein
MEINILYLSDQMTTAYKNGLPGSAINLAGFLMQWTYTYFPV